MTARRSLFQMRFRGEKPLWTMRRGLLRRGLMRVSTRSQGAAGAVRWGEAVGRRAGRGIGKADEGGGVAAFEGAAGDAVEVGLVGEGAEHGAELLGD